MTIIVVIIGITFIQPIQMGLCRKSKVSSHFFIAFLRFISIFDNLKKGKLQCLSISEIIESEKRVYLNVSKVFF